MARKTKAEKKAKAPEVEPETTDEATPEGETVETVAPEAPEVEGELAPLTYEKSFVLLARDYSGDDAQDHGAAYGFTVREALAAGWRAIADPTFVGSEPHADGKSVILKYRVEVVAAS